MLKTKSCYLIYSKGGLGKDYTDYSDILSTLAGIGALAEDVKMNE